MNIVVKRDPDPNDEWRVWKVTDPEDGKVLFALTWEFAISDLVPMMLFWRTQPNRGCMEECTHQPIR